MPKPKPIVLFSTNTLLAFQINQKYYDEKHFVYCNPYSNAKSPPRGTVMPPSSTPCDLFRTFEEDVRRSDLHSAAIKRNRVGLLRGADAKRKQGVITKAQETEIRGIVNSATIDRFTPLLYVIPYALVKTEVKPVPIASKADPFSEEFIIEELPLEAFAIVEF